MGREIKFRAWDIRNEYMFVQKPQQLLSVFLHLVEQDTIAGGEKFVMMQYTGLKDKNGVEIYEGDIVRDVYWGQKEQATGQVYWKEFSWVIGKSPKHKTWWEFSPVVGEGGGSVEVIGNIYKNPDLLEANHG